MLRGTLISAVILLFLLEGASQYAYRIQFGYWHWEAGDAFRVDYVQTVPDRRQYTLAPNFRDPDRGLTIDAHGFRFLTPEAPQGASVIVFLGDSVPFGAGVKDHETYPARFAQLLNDDPSVFAVNAGVPSYNFRQSVDRLTIDVLPRYRPRIIVIQAANDVSLLTWYRSTWTPDVTWAGARFSLPTRVAKNQASAFMSLVASALQTRALPALESHEHNLESGDLPVDAMLQSVRLTIRSLAAQSAIVGANVVLLPIDPFYYQDRRIDANSALPQWKDNRLYVDEWGDLIDKLNAAIQEEAASNGAYFFDSRSLIDKSSRADMYVDFIHYSPSGNKFVARELMMFLKSQGLL